MNRALFVFAFLMLFFASCEHDKNMLIAGKGGNASVIVYPQHHGVSASLDSMVIYVKYNVTDAPADGKYDDSATCVVVNSVPSCTFSGLQNGNYYFYGKGYDFVVAQRVKGGTPYGIVAQKQTSLLLPVGEE